jgi:hypothetical protein
MTRWLLVLVGILLLVPATVMAQPVDPADTATLRLEVTDEDGAPVANLGLEIEAIGERYPLVTDDQGVAVLDTIWQNDVRLVSVTWQGQPVLFPYNLPDGTLRYQMIQGDTITVQYVFNGTHLVTQLPDAPDTVPAGPVPADAADATALALPADQPVVVPTEHTLLLDDLSAPDTTVPAPAAEGGIPVWVWLFGGVLLVTIGVPALFQWWQRRNQSGGRG